MNPRSKPLTKTQLYEQISQHVAMLTEELHMTLDDKRADIIDVARATVCFLRQTANRIEQSAERLESEGGEDEAA